MNVAATAAGVARTLRHPVASIRGITAGGPVYPLIVLFGLNAVDELDRTAFGILLPEIRDEFGLDLQGVLTLLAFVSIGALSLQVPIAMLADRYNRVRIAWAGALLWAVFSLGTGLATGIVFLAIVRTGSGIGRAVVDPTHNSLLADYYPPEIRPRVFSAHRAANAVGAFIGPLTAGLLAAAYGWRAPFFVFVVPTLVFVVLAWRLKPPVRGGHERRAMGSSDAAIATEEAAPSFAEGWRLVWKIETLRRIWYSLPFLAASLIGFVSLASLLYEEVFDLDERARGFVAASTEPIQLVGLVVGARVATRLLAEGADKVLGFLSKSAFIVSACLVLFALAPNIWVAIAANMVITACLAVIGPGILAALSLAIPPRARSMGFSVASLWVIPGVLVLPIIGAVGDRYGIRQGMLLMVPMFFIGGLLIATTKRSINADIAQVWKASAARSEALLERREGRSNLLLIRDVQVSYGNVQVLFGVDLEVAEGDVVALLGTNGAGKSTLLNAISGVTEADRGAIIFDGRDITHAPPNEIAALGIAQVPGGKGIFPSLSVKENLELAGWLTPRSGDGMDTLRELFPLLAERPGARAGDLSGGQQQMLALAMALRSTPRLLMIDELSLGLAPVIVAQLLPVIERFREQGTTVLLVEQSVNVALDVAEHAVFLEKGEVRFDGATADLLQRGDVLRSVFLAGTASDEDARPIRTITANPEIGDATAVAALEAIDLTRTFGGIMAVREASFSVAPGEILGIIGPNGAGKTTLFDLLSGFVSADRGEVHLAGEDITHASASGRARRGLGRSFQDARLFPSLTVEETIGVALERWVGSRSALAAALHLPTSYDTEVQVARRVDELIELLGLEVYRSRFIRELSTGTRRVVDLAALLAHRPTVILLDEPSSGIAQREVEALAPLLHRIRDTTEASLVVIEHDMPLLRSVSDRLVAMDQGAVIATGTPAAVLSDPVVVESYLGPDDTAVNRSTITSP